jgi:predicted O-methyltransferase YrrM
MLATADEAINNICKYFSFNKDEFYHYFNEDNDIGGYPEKWPVGSIWEIDGKLLYSIVRCKKPQNVLEIGTRYGCSALHILKALDANNKGLLKTVDMSQDILRCKNHPRIEAISSEGISYSKSIDYTIDLIFEDGPHNLYFNYNFLHNCLPHLSKGGIVLIHDVEHFSVGEETSSGVIKALGPFEKVLVSPSDCGLGYWKKI